MYIEEKGNYEKIRKTQHLDKILPHVHNEIIFRIGSETYFFFLEVISVQLIFFKAKVIKV